MDSLNFKANFIKTVDIKKLQKTKYYTSKASLIELQRSDNSVLQKIAQEWHTPLMDRIADYACFCLGKSDYHIYAITNQNNDFVNLKKENILGVMETEEKDEFVRLNYLQVREDLISHKYGTFSDFLMNKLYVLLGIKAKPEYKLVGSNLVNYLLENCEKDIVLKSISAAENFYKKLGFIKFKNTTKYNMNMIKKYDKI